VQLKRTSGDRESMLAEMAARLPYVYVPRFYGPHDPNNARSAIRPIRPGVPSQIEPAVVPTSMPFRPLRAHRALYRMRADRITIEIMRGCRESASAKARTISAVDSARSRTSCSRDGTIPRTGHNEVSLLSLSTSDYPQFAELMRRLQRLSVRWAWPCRCPVCGSTEQLRKWWVT